MAVAQYFTMKKIIIHVGTHKTGSTFLQRFLETEKRVLLEKHKVAYIDKPTFYFSGIGKTTEVSEKTVNQIKQDIKDAFARSSGANTVLLSYEYLTGNPETGYDNAELIANTLKVALEGYKTEIIIVLRRQDYFLESMYTQLIHQGESLSFETYISSLPTEAFNWNTLLLAYESAFGSDSVKPIIYSEAFIDPKFDLLKLFLEALEINHFERSSEKQSVAINKSVSRESLEIMRRLNKYMTKTQSRSLRLYLQSNFSKAGNETLSLFNAKEREDFIEKHSSSNKNWLERHNLTGSFFLQVDQTAESYSFDANAISFDRITEVLGPWIHDNLKLSDGQRNKKRNVFSRILQKLRG